MNSNVVYYSDRKLITFNTYKREEIVTNSTDKFMVVTQGVEFRPDLISKAAYGVPDFWWRILQANNIADIYDLKAGINIRLPEVLLA